MHARLLNADGQPTKQSLSHQWSCLLVSHMCSCVGVAGCISPVCLCLCVWLLVWLRCEPASGSPRDDAALLPWREQLEGALHAAFGLLRSPTEQESNPLITSE